MLPKRFLSPYSFGDVVSTKVKAKTVFVDGEFAISVHLVQNTTTLINPRSA